MKTTERFDNAVSKLYNAFRNGYLNAMDCKSCAVGNMCNNTDEWIECYNSDTGYSPQELINIEKLFMSGQKPNTVPYYVENFMDVPKEYLNYDGLGWDACKVRSNKNPDLVFLAMSAVIEYLCELDNIPNVMDYTKLFETKNNQPKYQLL